MFSTGQFGPIKFRQCIFAVRQSVFKADFIHVYFRSLLTVGGCTSKKEDARGDIVNNATKIKGQRLEEVENFKYLGAIISNEGSKPEILSRIAKTTVALSRLKIIWRDKNISLASKVKLTRTLILFTFLYACESWTLTAEIERRIQALEMRCYRRLLNISYKDHVTNEEVCNRIQNATGVHDDLLTMVKKRKLRWYGHISRSSGMAKTILQGTVKGARRRGRQKKRWEDDVKDWTGMGFGDSLRAAEDREGWKGIVATSCVVPRRPPRLRDWDDEMRCVSYCAYFKLYIMNCMELILLMVMKNCS